MLIKQYICPKLSEQFIKEFVGKVNHSSIPLVQNLSEQFIKEFVDKVNYSMV
jgi:hypothetical protein